MLILGVNFGHDSSVAIIKNGKLIAAIEEEKISRVKQDFGWPKYAIERLFEEHNLNKNDVDLIALDQEIPYSLGKDEIHYRFTKGAKEKNKEYLNRITSYLGLSTRKINKRNVTEILKLVSKQGFINSDVIYYDHHLSHSASAYYTSPNHCDLIVTSDGMGGDSSFNFYTPCDKGLTLIRKNDYSVSVGAFYSMITKLLGYRPTRHEGKITGLAAFGTETDLVEKFDSLWKYENDKLIRFPFINVDKQWEKFGLDKGLTIVERINLKNSSSSNFLDYAKRSRVILAWLEETTKGYCKEDIAFACQKVAEKITIVEIKKVINQFFPEKNVSIGLAGGVFANVRINQMIYELEEVDNIYIQPAMGDSGIALGNAILADIEYRSKDNYNRKYIFNHTYWGPNYSEDLKIFIDEFNDDSIEVEKMEFPSKSIAKLLNENKIVGLCTGALEWGPRALGSRSIILNTFDKSVNDSLNVRLNRTEFMPFAPVVLDKLASEYFPKYDSKVPAADFMTMTYDTDSKYHELLQATVHIDGTARPQIAYESKNKLYYNILEEFYKISGCGALVNTSFNAHEEPILSSPQTAINALKSDRVDYLVLENYLLRKK